MATEKYQPTPIKSEPTAEETLNKHLGITNLSNVDKVKNAYKKTREVLTTPTDIELVNKLMDGGIRDYVSVPCSITKTVESIVAKKAERNEMNYYPMVNEHSLPGVATGIYLSTDRPALIHMQNSGLPNAADGIISFGNVYKIPMLALVTWRGNDKKDDSEPHQEIGRITADLTRTVFNKGKVHGDRWGKGILQALNNNFEDLENGDITVLRLSPYAFKNTVRLTLPEDNFDLGVYMENYERTKELHGDYNNSLKSADRIERDEAIERILNRHADSAVLFSNGFTSRAAQDKNDRKGNFYNVGYMGGTLAVGWGMAKSNPDIDVVVVDGDQNSEMGKMHEILANDYPDNLHWYILDNRIGASVGTARSIPRPPWYRDLAKIIDTIPDEPEGEKKFRSPRVGKRGKSFETEEAQIMADLIGPLPVHAEGVKHYILNRSAKNRERKKTERLYNTSS